MRGKLKFTDGEKNKWSKKKSHRTEGIAVLKKKLSVSGRGRV